MLRSIANYSSRFSLITLCFTLSVTACQRQFMSGRSAYAIDHVLLLKPYVAVNLVLANGEPTYSHLLSEQLSTSLWTSLEQVLPKRIGQRKLELDSLTQAKINREIFDVTINVGNRGRMGGIPIGVTTTETLNQYGCDFAVGTLCFSNVPTAANGHPIRGERKNHFTLLIGLVLDRCAGNIAFYGMDADSAAGTVDAAITSDRVRKILSAYFGR